MRLKVAAVALLFLSLQFVSQKANSSIYCWTRGVLQTCLRYRMGRKALHERARSTQKQEQSWDEASAATRPKTYEYPLCPPSPLIKPFHRSLEGSRANGNDVATGLGRKPSSAPFRFLEDLTMCCISELVIRESAVLPTFAHKLLQD
jgi:hypothetical protein